MATAPPIKPEIVRYDGSVGTGRDSYPEAAAQSYQSGTFTFVNASGQLQTCDGAVPGNITAIWGIDSLPASGVTNTGRSVEPITSGTEIKITTWNGADPNGLGVPTAQTMVMDRYAITMKTVAGVQYWVLDLNNNVDQIAQITRLAPEWVEGTTRGPVYVKILKSFLQFQP